MNGSWSSADSSGSFADLSSVRIVATIEARMKSSRLPGKVLADVGGVPMLAMMIGRLRRSQTISAICVATTDDRADDPVEALARDVQVECFRGSEEDVLARVLGAARAKAADLIVETTGDCPLIDPAILDACVLAYLSEDVHYCSNTLLRTFPRGLDVQVFSTAVLAEVDSLTQDAADHEHVSLYIYEHPEQYRLRNVPAVGPLRRPDWRWTVDTAEDLEFVRQVVGHLGHSVSTREATTFLETRPDIVGINQHIRQKPVR